VNVQLKKKERVNISRNICLIGRMYDLLYFFLYICSHWFERKCAVYIWSLCMFKLCVTAFVWGVKFFLERVWPVWIHPRWFLTMINSVLSVCGCVQYKVVISWEHVYISHIIEGSVPKDHSGESFYAGCYDL